MAIAVAATNDDQHKARMFILNCSEFPRDAASLLIALNNGAKSAGLADSAFQLEGELPSLNLLRLDLTSAKLDQLRRAGKVTPDGSAGFFARTARIEAKPAWYQQLAVQIQIEARDCVFSLGRTADGTSVASPTRCSAGTFEASAPIASIEQILLDAARKAAAEHGAEVESVRLKVVVETPRKFAITATAVAKAMFFTATLILSGSCEVDAEGTVRLSGLTCSGDGMIANLAASQLRPRLNEWEGRSFSLQALLPAGLALTDFSVESAMDITIRAAVSNANNTAPSAV